MKINCNYRLKYKKWVSQVKEILAEVKSVCYNEKRDGQDSAVITQRIDFMYKLLSTRKERLAKCLEV